MLDADYIRDRAEGAGLIAEELHKEIIRAMVDRYMARMGRGESFLTATDKWQLQVLADAGYLMKDIQAEIAKETGRELTEIAKAFEDAAIVNMRWDDDVYRKAGLEPMPLRQSPMLMRLVQRGYDKTAGEWKNFTGTLADKAQQTFIKQCDTAYHLVTSGAMSYSQAVVQAVERTARDGVTVEYTRERADGSKYVYHTDTIETATLRAVRTGAGQACGDITLARMEELGWDIVLTSAHIGARTGKGDADWRNHAWWQGKFYSLSGEDDRFPRFALCGWGYVDGIYGANCRHSIGPGDGEHNPFEHIDSEANRLREERDARMRLLERRIRASRREVLALQEAVEKAPDAAVKAEAEAAYRRKAKVLMRQEKEYDDFCKENKTRKLYDRLQVAQYGAKQARAAEKAGEGKSLANAGKSDIMEVSEEIDMGVDVGIDKFTPCLENTRNGEIVETTYSLASRDELKGLKKKGWAFNWSATDLKNAEIYKLNVKGTSEIQGLIAITPQERDKAMYVNIVESAPHNKGTGKQYYGVGGHLFAIAAQKSVEKGYGGFLFLDAKNMELVKYYREKLGAQWIGGPHQYRMFIDERAALELLNKYTLEGN